MPVPRPRFLVPVLLLALTACGTPSPSGSLGPSPGTDASAAPSGSPHGSGAIVPAPGSNSELYRPNPRAITVAIDPGHGGCLDWGVPDPLKRGPNFAEKTMTLGIATALRTLLQAQGVRVVMTRNGDVALAGDNDPGLGCTAGLPWRDVDGDGKAGFEETGRVRTRDELQARIDLANLARADVLVSIHINSPTESGVPVDIAFTESYYDDETPWGIARSAKLADLVQAGVSDALRGVSYKRQDRGTEARAFYIIARQWASGDRCEVPGDTWCSPHRGLQAPGILSEVGSISLPAEHEMLVNPQGQEMVARGIEHGLAEYFADRPLAVRYDALVPGGEAGVSPVTAPGAGPPFRATSLPAVTSGGISLPLRLTNTGTADWPSGLRLLAGWQVSQAPYLAAAPAGLRPLNVAVPRLAPGESLELTVSLPAPDGSDRQLLWLTLADGTHPLSDAGSPALQLARLGN